jgi:glycosyltransferase involved in cell wall biosynthesis
MLVGEGRMEAEVREWARRHQGRVRVVTGAAHADVPDYLNAMDLLCAPSQTTARWREQFGRALIEAFACGIPVVGSDSGEIPYVVRDAGVIVAEADHEGWVRELEALLGSPMRRAELSSRGLDRARSEYGWAIVARKHLEFFEEILSA